ncbi:hypothetical protein [Azospirillum argentinense]
MDNPNAVFHIDLWRTTVQRSDWWSAPWSDISEKTILPNGTKLTDDIWSPPKGWMKGVQCLDFNKALPDSWRRDEQRAEYLIRRLKRLAAIDFTTTVRTKSKKHSRPGSWTTWLSRNRLLHRAAKTVSNKSQYNSHTHDKARNPTRSPDGDPLFAKLSPTTLREALPNTSQPLYKLVNRMNALFANGLIDDWPAEDVSTTKYKKYERNITQPFSDTSFTILCRAAFTLAELQSDLLLCYRDLSTITVDDLGRRDDKYLDPYRQARLAEWKGTRVFPAATLGISFFLKDRSGSYQTGDLSIYYEKFDMWPLRTLGQLRQVLAFCQVANWVILAAATGARVGELDALTRDAIIDFVPDRWGGESNVLALLTGKTFKSESFGNYRQWPLPRQAVEAFMRQRRIVDALSPGEQSLWSSRFRNGGVFMYGRIKNFCNAVSLDGKQPIGQQIEGSVHPQRFRETLSRLVGLCLDNGHHVLFDVLGHRDMDTTLGYMLSDPDFAAQARRVRMEAETVRRRQIVAKADTMAGPAAKEIVRLRNTVARQAFGRRRDPNKPESADAVERISEFAELMTDEEMDIVLPYAAIVRPGIYCVATNSVPGLCSNSTVRDVSRCNPMCYHRLEEEIAGDDRRRAVKYILDKLSDRTLEALRHAYFQRQLLGLLDCSPSLVDEFLGNPSLRAALTGIAPTRVAMLSHGLQETIAALQDIK